MQGQNLSVTRDFFQNLLQVKPIQWPKSKHAKYQCKSLISLDNAMQCHLDYLNLNFHCLSLNSLPLTPNNKRNSHVVFVHRRHLNFSFIFHHKMELLNSFCSMVIGRSLSAFKIDELSTNFLICDQTSFNCGRSKFLAKLNDEDMIISNM